MLLETMQSRDSAMLIMGPGSSAEAPDKSILPFFRCLRRHSRPPMAGKHRLQNGGRRTESLRNSQWTVVTVVWRCEFVQDMGSRRPETPGA